MRKKIFAVALAATMTLTSTMTAFAADTSSYLIGKFSFEENLTNSVKGEGTPIGKGLAESSGTAFTYTDAVNGKGLQLGLDGNTDGIKLNVSPTGDNYTFGIWMKVDVTVFANPIMWYGGKDQPAQGESWTGIWPGLVDNWTTGPAIGSNRPEDDRPGATPKTGLASADDNKKFDWTFITAVFKGPQAELYYNGTLVGVTSDVAIIPQITVEDKDVYIGANAWDAPPTGVVDECYIYDRALTQDDVVALYEESKGSFTMPATTIDKLLSEEITTIGETTSAVPQIDTADYSAPKTETPAKKSNVWIYIACGVGAVLVIGVVVTLIAVKGKNDED